MPNYDNETLKRLLERRVYAMEPDTLALIEDLIEARIEVERLRAMIPTCRFCGQPMHLGVDSFRETGGTWRHYTCTQDRST